MQAVRYHRAGSRTTPRPYANAEFLASRTNEVHHYQEVARETHRLHNMQLKANALGLLFVQRFAIALLSPLVGEIGQIVRLKLDTI